MLIETLEQGVVNRVLAIIEVLEHTGRKSLNEQCYYFYLPIHHHGQQTQNSQRGKCNVRG